MRIAVVGAGGVGGFFGGRLARAGHDVAFLARGANLEAIRERGLAVMSVEGDFSVEVEATDDPAEIGPCDVVLFCVKSYDTVSAATRLPPLMNADTAVVSLQNGVENEERLARAIGWNHVVGGVAYLFAALEAPATVRHTGGPGRLVFGEWDGRPSERLDHLAGACRDAGIPADISPDIRVALWSKFVFIVAQAGMTATVRLPIGEVRESPAAWRMFRAIAEEVVAVARAVGVALPAGIVHEAVGLAASLEPGGYSSLHHDLVTGRRMELDALHGAVVRLAYEHNIPVPMNQAVLAVLEPWARRNEAPPG